MIQLYQFPQSGNSRAVRLVLLEKNIPFERVNINFAKGEHKSPEFLQLNPKGQVPVLVDGETVLTDSLEINDYLERTHPAPALMPAGEAAQAKAREHMAFFQQRFASAIGPVILETLLKPPPARNQELLAKKKQETLDRMAEMDGFLAEDDFFTGPIFGLADVLFIPPLAALPDLDMEIPASLAHLSRWWQAVSARPSFAESAR